MSLTLNLEVLNLESCIYCGACFYYCVLGVYRELSGEELRRLVARVTKIARMGYSEKDGFAKAELEKCTLCGYCNEVCPCLVKPKERNEIAKEKIKEFLQK
jgi:ferredoxin